MSHSAVKPAPRVLLDEESIRRTLSRIAHEIIERNEDLDTVALVGIHTRGVPIAHRLRHLIEERSGEELALGQLDITFHRDDVHVRAGQAPRRPQPLARETKLDFELEGGYTGVESEGDGRHRFGVSKQSLEGIVRM
jgi:pyrimidine operon attenuation protein / uracil phosphoribosyltransferase